MDYHPEMWICGLFLLCLPQKILLPLSRSGFKNKQDLRSLFSFLIRKKKRTFFVPSVTSTWTGASKLIMNCFLGATCHYPKERIFQPKRQKRNTRS